MQDSFSYKKQKFCLITSSPLILKHFMGEHLKYLKDLFNIHILTNTNIDHCFNKRLPFDQSIISVPIQRNISPISDLISFFKIIFFLKINKINIVLTVGPKAGLLGILAAYLAGVEQRIHIFQGEVWVTKTGFLKKLLKTSDFLTGWFSTKALAVSKTEKNFLIKHGIIKKNKILCLGPGSICGVNEKKFKPLLQKKSCIRKKLKLPLNGVICLYVGRLNEDKGILDLCNSFDKIINEKSLLYLCLLGPDEQNLKSKILPSLSKRAKKQVIFKSYSEKPYLYMQAADFLCLPSHREGFGLSLIEAGATGLPVIASNIYGIQDAVVDKKTGFLVPPKNQKKLAEKISFLAKNSKIRLKMGRYAAKYVTQKFNRKKVLNFYFEFFKKISQKRTENNNSKVLRVLDCLIAFFGILLLFPLFSVIMLLPKTWKKILFVQKRLGVNKKVFWMIKIKTMKTNTKNLPTHLVNLNQVSFFGKILRKTKIDELPQLWNVLKGEMSIVGPRPCLPSQIDVISARDKLGIFACRPGVTGLAQIQGIDMSAPKLLAKTDAEMIRTMSLSNYFKYILLTVCGWGIGDRIRLVSR